MKETIAHIAILLSYYCISSMATTNIMRLLKGSTLKQNDIHCYCDNCGHIIPIYQQLPLISYLLSKGKCKYCGTKIPFLTTAIEMIVFIAMSTITVLLHFRPSGVVFSFSFYEILRIVMLLIYGRRNDHFVREYIIAVAYIMAAFLLVLFMSAIASV